MYDLDARRPWRPHTMEYPSLAVIVKVFSSVQDPKRTHHLDTPHGPPPKEEHNMHCLRPLKQVVLWMNKKSGIT